MKGTFRFSQHGLNICWGASAVVAVLLFAAIYALNSVLVTRSGVGLFDLNAATSAPKVRFIMDRWQLASDASLSGLLLGIDFLWIPFYAVALYLGAVMARERFAPSGFRRRLFNALTAVPLLAAACDIAENILQAKMLVNGPDVVSAAMASEVSGIKVAGFLIGLVLTLAAALVALRGRLARGRK